ncbi:TetR/AcrR family transcriptional regulator [Sphaerisporangium sp. NPDC051011]|uniref:TetR/AcrR family transcriptional regulator n=1 Tax=Sphaerisporangium sp. NPDC051011 TaxID=3155792 RepID=UPI0033CCF324
MSELHNGADGNSAKKETPTRQIGSVLGPALRELPLLQFSSPEQTRPPVQERADAARNRARVLEAAERLFATMDARDVTMEEIARAAGVGRATLYRRYPDPASICIALLDEHERRLQEDLLRGEPPLGPGAPPTERLVAFYEASVDLLERHLHLILGAETGRARFVTGAYDFWRVHVRMLLVHAEAPDPDGAVDPVLAPLAPEVYRFQRRTLGLSKEQITESLIWMARRLTDRA